MRGLSTIELLVALAVTTSVITATTSLTLGMPAALQDARLERDAYAFASELLTETERRSHRSPGLIVPTATTTKSGYAGSLHVEYLYDELAARITAHVAWTDVHGANASMSAASLITDPELAGDLSCSPFLSGDWTQPRIVNDYQLTPGDLLPPEHAQMPYAVSSLAILKEHLVIGSNTSASTSQPTLFFFRMSSSSTPAFLAAFDNAPASRAGISGVAVGGGHAYAANGFGSASLLTCATNDSCTQLQVFGLLGETPVRTGKLMLPADTPPYARTVPGSTAGARSIAYRRGYIFLGLEKTANGSEFNIIDVSDPQQPRWISGVPIGRSVEHITVTRTHAYLATSDSSNELVVIDIRDPERPVRVGSWDAPGTPNFGIGSSIAVRNSVAYFGRTYVNNAPEFVTLDVTDPAHIAPLAHVDTETYVDPQGVRGTVVRESLAAFLSGSAIRFMHVEDPTALLPYAPSIDLPGSGTALACSGPLLMAGSDVAGSGRIHIISGS